MAVETYREVKDSKTIIKCAGDKDLKASALKELITSYIAAKNFRIDGENVKPVVIEQDTSGKKRLVIHYMALSERQRQMLENCGFRVEGSEYSPLKNQRYVFDPENPKDWEMIKNFHLFGSSQYCNTLEDAISVKRNRSGLFWLLAGIAFVVTIILISLLLTTEAIAAMLILSTGGVIFTMVLAFQAYRLSHHIIGTEKNTAILMGALGLAAIATPFLAPSIAILGISSASFIVLMTIAVSLVLAAAFIYFSDEPVILDRFVPTNSKGLSFINSKTSSMSIGTAIENNKEPNQKDKIVPIPEEAILEVLNHLNQAQHISTLKLNFSIVVPNNLVNETDRGFYFQMKASQLATQIIKAVAAKESNLQMLEKFELTFTGFDKQELSLQIDKREKIPQGLQIDSASLNTLRGRISRNIKKAEEAEKVALSSTSKAVQQINLVTDFHKRSNSTPTLGKKDGKETLTDTNSSTEGSKNGKR